MHEGQFVLPVAGVYTQLQHTVGRAKHGLGLHHLVIKLGVHFVVGLEDEGLSLVGNGGQLELLHLFLHALELLGELELLLGAVRDLFNLDQLACDALLGEGLNGDCLRVQIKVVDGLLDLVPIFFVKSLRHDALHQGHVVAEVIHFLFELGGSV